MKIDLKTQGLDQAVSEVSEMPGTMRGITRGALRDVGRQVKRELSQAISAGGPVGAAWPGVSAVSKKIARAQGGKVRKPWSALKTHIKATVSKRTNTVVIGLPDSKKRWAARKLTEGGTSQMPTGKKGVRLQRYLASMGIFKRKDRPFRVPGRPLFSPVFRNKSGGFARLYEERFHYRLSRSLRKWRVSR